METDFSDSGVPATRADIALVLSAVERGRLEQQSELRAFRVWVEGKFELVEAKFQMVEQRIQGLEERLNETFASVAERFEATNQRVDAGTQRAIQTMTWRMAVMWASTVAVVIGTRAGS